MGLKKSIELPSGVSAEYWRISVINRPFGKTVVIVDGYLNKTARDAKKMPLTRNSFTGGTIESVESAYTFLKTQEMFDGAEDA